MQKVPFRFSFYTTELGSQAYVGNLRSEEKNTILYSDLAYTWNILEPISIIWNILGNMILYSYLIPFAFGPPPGICIFVFPT